MHIPVSPDIRRNEDYVELEDLRAKNCAPELREMKAFTSVTSSMTNAEIHLTILGINAVYHGTNFIPDLCQRPVLSRKTT